MGPARVREGCEKSENVQEAPWPEVTLIVPTFHKAALPAPTFPAYARSVAGLLSPPCPTCPPTGSPISTISDLALDLQACPHLHVHVHNLKFPLHQQRNIPYKSITCVPHVCPMLFCW